MDTDSELDFEAKVVSDPPDWSQPTGRSRATSADKILPEEVGREGARGACFYIDADVSRGWPRRSRRALCKFGVTHKPLRIRCWENQKSLQKRWGIEADLRVVFAATGHITTAEKEIADHTLGWLPGPFEKNSEWRLISPRQLARTAALIAEKRHRRGDL